MENKTVSLSGEDFEQLFKALPGLFVVLSPDLRVLEASEQYLQATHTSAQDLKELYLLDVFPENPSLKGQKPKEAIEASLQHVLTAKEPHTLPNLRYDIKNEAGVYEERYWMLRSIPMLSDTKAVRYILHEVQDITERTIRERDSQASEQNLKLLTQTMGGTLWEADLVANTITWNESYVKIFGFGKDELEMPLQDWMQHIHEEDILPIRTKFNKLLTDREKTFNMEFRYGRADGSYAHVFTYGHLLYDQHNKPVRILGSTLDLSKQKEAERKYVEANERFKRITMATTDVIWDWNLADDTIWWNEGFKSFFGYKAEDIEPTIDSWTTRIHPDDHNRVKTSIHKAINSGEAQWVDEYRFRCADGNYVIVLDRGFVIRDAQGAAIRMVGAMVDITEKTHVEQELADTMERLQQVMDSLPLMTWIAKPDGAVEYYNQRWYDYTGCTFEELKEWGWTRIIHPDDEATTRQLWAESLATGKSFVTENRWKSSENGEYHWFLGRAVAVRDTAGNITMWVGSHTDIDEQKQLQQRMVESEEQFRFLAESIAQMVWTTDANGYHTYFNQRWIDYTGLTMEESLGMVWNDVLHPDDRQRFLERWEYSLRTGDFYEIEYRFKNGRDGNYRWFLGQAMPMRNAEGEVIRWFGTCTDIEDHKRAEEELVERNLELKRINQDLDSFVYTASHDLKLPIINMAGIFEELVRSARFSDPDAPRMIEMFSKSLQQIHNTIHDLAEVVKVQKNSARDYEPIDLLQLTEDVKVSIQDLLQDTGASIITDFDAAPAIAFSRPNLKSIFYNLLSNAIKYRAHERTPEIRLSTTWKGDFIELQVQDNGIGIDMNKHQSKLFQLFKRFHNHVTGSGLGLYIVNRLLTNNDGYINIESKLNKGTTFYLYFKQNKAH